MEDFGTALPGLRERIDADLGRSGLPRERVLAAVARLVDDTLIRVGNEQYRRANGSFGATTIRQRHANVEGSRVSVEFPGKGGKLQHAEVADRRLARTVQRLHDLPGRELFEYLDGEGERHRVHSEDVNAYLQDVSGEDLTVKDFRTWGASALSLRALSDLGEPPRRQTPSARSTRRFARSRTLSATRRRSAARRTSILHCSRPTPKASCRRRRNAGCRVSTAGSPPCCASCAPIHDVAPTLSISDSISASALLVRLDSRAASTSAFEQIQSGGRDLDLIGISEQARIGGIAYPLCFVRRHDAAVERAQAHHERTV